MSSLENMYLIRINNQANQDYAEYDEDYVYRYVLKRNIQKHPRRWHIPMAFIMLNPSTATETKNDPTIRRCISFAEREGCTELYILNLFAYRSTNPKHLETTNKDPIGPFNDKRIEDIVSRVRINDGKIVAAWGARRFARGRGAEIAQKFGPFLCLGYSKHGDPRHPLYVKSNQKLELYK